MTVGGARTVAEAERMAALGVDRLTIAIRAKEIREQCATSWRAFGESHRGDPRSVRTRTTWESLDGQVAIVTGAGQGVGRGVALAVAAEGAKVAVLGRTVSKCDAVVDEIRRAAARRSPIECDVEHRDQIDASVQRIVERWGRIDLLVNNAQTKVYQSMRRMTDADMDTMWQSGPMASFRFMQACFPHLRESQGCVVNMGSGSSIMPHGAMAGYAMTKEAVRVLCRASAPSSGDDSGSVSTRSARSRCHPVWRSSTTPRRARSRRRHAAHSAGATGATRKPTSARRSSTSPSDAGRYITGTTLMVDGGYNYLR